MKFFKRLFGHKKIKSEMDRVYNEYEIIVNWLASNAPDDWKQAKVACKFFEGSSHGTFHYLVGKDLSKKFPNLPMRKSHELYGLFKNLRVSHEGKNKDWVGCYFSVNNLGKFNINYIYEDFDLKKAINGELKFDT